MRGAHLDGAIYVSETEWPSGFEPQAAGAILVDDDDNPIISQ